VTTGVKTSLPQNVPALLQHAHVVKVQEVAPKTAGTRDIVGGLQGPSRVSCSLPETLWRVDDADRDVTGLPSFAAAVAPCWEDVAEDDRELWEARACNFITAPARGERAPRPEG
jgi:hypothetical protein